MIDDGIGHSEYTEEKNEVVRSIFKINLIAWKSILNKYHSNQTYTFFDINAGVGIHQDYGWGSPLIFLDEAKKINIKFCAHFIEINERNSFDLLINMNKEFGEHAAYIWTGDHEKILRKNWIDNQKQSNKIPGLIYSDPTGSPPPFKLLSDFAAIWQSVDQLIYFSATNFKRVGRYKLIKMLEHCNKKLWTIREPIGCHQWTFLYLSNGHTFEWKKAGFYPVNSKDGKEILDHLNYTKKELENAQQPVLF